MKPPIFIIAFLLLITSCAKYKNVLPVENTYKPTKDFREKYTGVFKLDVSDFVGQSWIVLKDTLYKNRYYTFFYKITDTAYYPMKGEIWYQLPAIRVSLQDSAGFTDTSKYTLWGIRDSLTNEIVYRDTKHGQQETHKSEGGFILNTATSTLDSIYLKYSYGTPKIHSRKVFQGARVK